MVKMWRSAFWVAGITTLAACAAESGVVANPMPTSCLADSGTYLKGVDWGKAETVHITYRNGGYSPLITNLNVGKPYILRITNKDEIIRGFKARELFNSVAVAKVSHDGKEVPDNCPGAVNIAPLKTAEIRLVTVESGSYYFTDDPIVFGRAYPDSLTPSPAMPDPKGKFFFQEDIAVGSGGAERGFGILAVR